jgi:N,N'-diacetyllegionaminate synthase
MNIQYLGKKPMVIAECCGNHQGNMNILHQMVDLAADAGAAACKIQSFFADDLSDEWIFKDYKRLKRLELSWTEQKEFATHCRSVGIIPMTSVYTSKYIPMLREAGFVWIKIGSAQADKSRMIWELKEAGFSTIVSTGGHDVSNFIMNPPGDIYLHCVSEYPTPAGQANLSRMLELKRATGKPVGFSDHTDPMDMGWDIACKIALYLGAEVVEKHLTILPRREVKDGVVSIDIQQLREISRFSKLSRDEMLAELPGVGDWMYPYKQKEFDLISQYKTRWKV